MGDKLRYGLFASLRFYPSGGWDDLAATDDDVRALMPKFDGDLWVHPSAVANDVGHTPGWWHIVDFETREVVVRADLRHPSDVLWRHGELWRREAVAANVPRCECSSCELGRQMKKEHAEAAARLERQKAADKARAADRATGKPVR